MDKYIKADDLIDRIYPVDPENDGSDGCTIVMQNLKLSSQEIEAIVDEIPAADVAPVVSCKDCKFYFETHNEMDETLCLNRQWDSGQPWRAIVKPMDFCSYGERKVNTHELP